MKSIMTTFTGKKIDPLNLTDKDIDIVDIAHHLACVNRFAGAARVPVNVAHHSIFVSILVPPYLRLKALLHDGSEAYLGDIVKWLKSSPPFAEYRRVEHGVQQKIWTKFGCTADHEDHIETADRLAVRYEAAQVMPRIDTPVESTKLYGALTESEVAHIDVACKKHFGMPWRPMNWHDSEQLFMLVFKQLAK